MFSLILLGILLNVCNLADQWAITAYNRNNLIYVNRYLYLFSSLITFHQLLSSSGQTSRKLAIYDT